MDGAHLQLRGLAPPSLLAFCHTGWCGGREPPYAHARKRPLRGNAGLLLLPSRPSSIAVVIVVVVLGVSHLHLEDVPVRGDIGTPFVHRRQPRGLVCCV